RGSDDIGACRKRAAEGWRKQGTPTETVQDQPAECRKETASLVADALARLPQEGRSLIWLREVEGYSYAELAETLEIPIGTVRSRLFGVREELRKIWRATPQAKERDS